MNSTAQEETTQEGEQTYDEIVNTATISPQSIQLPMSFSMGDDVSAAVASMVVLSQMR